MPAPDPAPIELLVEGHRRFLAFLERRTGSRAEAEDVLQEAFGRVLASGAAPRRREATVAWFQRLLANALVDRARRRAAGERALAARAAAEEEAARDVELEREVCRCVQALLPLLPATSRELLERVELGGETVAGAAAELGITAGNASVRLHRARKRLRRELARSCGTCAEHGCLDCQCGGPASCGEGV